MTVSPFLKAPLRSEELARAEKLNLEYRWVIASIKGMAEQAERTPNLSDGAIRLIAKTAREALK